MPNSTGTHSSPNLKCTHCQRPAPTSAPAMVKRKSDAVHLYAGLGIRVICNERGDPARHYPYSRGLVWPVSPRTDPVTRPSKGAQSRGWPAAPCPPCVLQGRNRDRADATGGTFEFKKLVGGPGFEPGASRSRTVRAAKLRQPPTTTDPELETNRAPDDYDKAISRSALRNSEILPSGPHLHERPGFAAE